MHGSSSSASSSPTKLGGRKDALLQADTSYNSAERSFGSIGASSIFDCPSPTLKPLDYDDLDDYSLDLIANLDLYDKEVADEDATKGKEKEPVAALSFSPFSPQLSAASPPSATAHTDALDPYASSPTIPSFDLLTERAGGFSATEALSSQETRYLFVSHLPTNTDSLNVTEMIECFKVRAFVPTRLLPCLSIH